MASKQSVFLVGAALAGMLVAAGCSSKSEVKSSTGGARAVMGECHEINACKGKGECGGAGHMCAGKNACKGKGWLKMSKHDCAKKGGKFKAM